MHVYRMHQILYELQHFNEKFHTKCVREKKLTSGFFLKKKFLYNALQSNHLTASNFIWADDELIEVYFKQ